MPYPNAATYLPTIVAASVRYGVPVWVIQTTIAKESSFNPSARRSESGGRVSRGLMQLLEGTARALGFTGEPASLLDPAISIDLGTAYLASLRRRYPGEDWPAIYAAYNSGAIRRNETGQFVTKGGDPIVQRHVDGWSRIAPEFREAEAGIVPAGLALLVVLLFFAGPILGALWKLAKK